LNWKLSPPKEKEKAPPNIRVRPLKRRRRRRKVKVDPKLGGQWKEEEKVLGLVANGRRRRRRRFLAWWPLEGEGKGSWLGGQWKEKEKVLFYLFHFSPKKLYLNLHFLSFTLRFYFALILGHYLRLPFVFVGL
jgi:hypothetical protein